MYSLRSETNRKSAFNEWAICIRSELFYSDTSRRNTACLRTLCTQAGTSRQATSHAWRALYSRPKGVEGVGGKDADAKNYKKCCKSFKHVGLPRNSPSKRSAGCTVKMIRQERGGSVVADDSGQLFR